MPERVQPDEELVRDRHGRRVIPGRYDPLRVGLTFDEATGEMLVDAHGDPETLHSLTLRGRWALERWPRPRGWTD